MMKLYIQHIKEAARKRALFNRTVAEIEMMPRDVSFDLNICKSDARRLAYQAVYAA